MVWGFAEKVSKLPEIPVWIKESAINALMIETKGIDMDDLMAEPVYVWAIDNMQCR